MTENVLVHEDGADCWCNPTVHGDVSNQAMNVMIGHHAKPDGTVHEISFGAER